jgi:hypothetical protein
MAEELAHYCSTSDPAATNGMMSKATGSGTRIAAIASTSTVLMTWYQYEYYGGNHTLIYGSAGTCDTAGYRVPANSYWDGNIRSIKGAGNCNYVTMYRTAGYYPPYVWSQCLPAPVLNSTVSGHVAYMYVKRRDYCPWP